MITETNKCPHCGKVKQLIKSNNPLVKGICADCLNAEINYNSLKQAEFFCRTYNLPWLPSRWLEIATEAKEEVFQYYVEVISEEYKPNLYYSTQTADLWAKTEEEWKKVLDHRTLIEKIKPIKQGFLDQMQIKWGTSFTFEEYLHLEDIYTNTVKRAGITNPITLDVVKKIAIVSVHMDKALEEGDIKGAAEFSKMHKNLTDSAGLDKMIEVGDNPDQITNVSDLCDFLEKNNFQFDWTIPVSKDIVDATIKDQQEWYINFFRDGLGIQQTYDLVEKSYREAMEDKNAAKAQAELNLDEIMNQVKQGLNEEIDEELDNQDFALEDDIHDIDSY